MLLSLASVSWMNSLLKWGKAKMALRWVFSLTVWMLPDMHLSSDMPLTSPRGNRVVSLCQQNSSRTGGYIWQDPRTTAPLESGFLPVCNLSCLGWISWDTMRPKSSTCLHPSAHFCGFSLRPALWSGSNTCAKLLRCSSKLFLTTIMFQDRQGSWSIGSLQIPFHESLEGSGSVTQTERHDIELVESIWSTKCSLRLVEGSTSTCHSTDLEWQTTWHLLMCSARVSSARGRR